MKTDERRRARELRAEGWSVKEIERELGVSRSSVSRWVRDVSLGTPQRSRLVARSRLGPIVAAERKRAAALERRREYQAIGRRLAREGGPSYAAGCMLFWAEGSKERNSVKVVNSDPALLRVVADFLRAHFGVTDDAFRLRCNLFADHLARRHEIETFWLTTLRLPKSCLRRSAVNVYSKYTLKKRANKLPYGTAELIVHDTQILQTIYGSIQEYGGFDRPEWLD
jgi:transcriptional regulator with XRE-family HTH domain